MKKIGVPTEEVLAAREIAASVKDIYLKVVSKGTHYDFYYSLTGDEEWTVLCKNVDAGYLSTAIAGGFTVSVIGLNATSK